MDEVFADAVVVLAGDGDGDLEIVEHDGGAFGVECVAAKRREDHGCGDLDGFAVFDGWEVEGERVRVGSGEVLGEDGVTLTVGICVERMDDGWKCVGPDVALTAAGVEVAVGLGSESGRAATAARDMNVSAFDSHDVLWVVPHPLPLRFGAVVCFVVVADFHGCKAQIRAILGAKLLECASCRVLGCWLSVLGKEKPPDWCRAAGLVLLSTLLF